MFFLVTANHTVVHYKAGPQILTVETDDGPVEIIQEQDDIPIPGADEIVSEKTTLLVSEISKHRAKALVEKYYGTNFESIDSIEQLAACLAVEHEEVK